MMYLSVHSIMKAGVFVDTSGSTGGVRAYHAYVAKMLSGLKEANANMRVFCWNSGCHESTLEEVLANSSGPMKAEGGTSVLSIWQHILQCALHFDTLILVTDGEIDMRDVRMAEAEISRHGRRWRRTEAHLVNPERSTADTSVIAPFIRDVPFEVFDAGGAVASSTLTSVEVIAMLDAIQNDDDMQARLPDLKARIAADTISGAPPMALRQAILRARTRLIMDRSARLMAAAADASDAPDASARTVADAVQHVTALAREFYGDRVEDPSKKDPTQELLDLCDSAGSFSLDRLKLARDARIFKTTPVAPPVADIPAEEYDSSSDAYVDPITMDVDMPVGLFTEGQGVLAAESDAVRAEIARNPLKLVCYPRVVDALRARVLRPYGLQTLRGMREHGMGTHPETRAPMMREVLCFGSDAAHEASSKACLARLMYGGTRLTGSYAVWMTVMWWVMRGLPYVTEAMGPQMDDHMTRLIRDTPERHRVFMGLSGLGDRPTQRVTLGEALLYAAVSTELWAHEHTQRDVMRDLHGAFPLIRDAMELAGTGEVAARVAERVRTLHTAARLLHRVKHEGTAAVTHELAARFAATLTLDGRTYILDAPANADADADAALHWTLLRDCVRPEFKFGALPLPPSPITLRDPVEDLRLGRNYSAEENSAKELGPSSVCPKTLRPYVFVGEWRPNQSREQWDDMSERVWGPLSEQVSIYKWLHVFYQRNKRFPDADSDTDLARFLDLLSSKYKHKGCLPVYIRHSVVSALQLIREALELRRARDPDSCDPAAIYADSVAGTTRTTREAMDREWARGVW
jgi:hypothetical protein